MAKITRLDGTVIPCHSSNYHILVCVADSMGWLHDVIIEDAQFSDFGLGEPKIENVTMRNCTFNDVAMVRVGSFDNVVFENCSFRGTCNLDWLKRPGVTLINCKINEPYNNEDLTKMTGGKIFSLPNKDFVKVECTCDFCHNTYYEIMSRINPHKMLSEVPFSDKRVCDQCYNTYNLRTKFPGQRTYGYHGALSFYRTPMDRRDTEIMGLEMEFEGDFWGWKELQDAHRGHLHYGYDSSVKGQNELSWDCGSYSYWKYLAPLKDVCEAIAGNGGSAGPTAGIHIHVSTPATNIRMITHKLNMLCRMGSFKTMMEAVSLRDDRQRFDTYANLGAPEIEHHAAISYNGHDTCEFRVFNSSLDYKLILRHIKFCKELYHMAKENVPKDKILSGFSKETKMHIKNCAKIQAEKGFISEQAAKILIDKLGV